MLQSSCVVSSGAWRACFAPGLSKLPDQRAGLPSSHVLWAPAGAAVAGVLVQSSAQQVRWRWWGRQAQAEAEAPRASCSLPAPPPSPLPITHMYNHHHLGPLARLVRHHACTAAAAAIAAAAAAIAAAPAALSWMRATRRPAVSPTATCACRSASQVRHMHMRRMRWSARARDAVAGLPACPIPWLQLAAASCEQAAARRALRAARRTACAGSGWGMRACACACVRAPPSRPCRRRIRPLPPPSCCHATCRHPGATPAAAAGWRRVAVCAWVGGGAGGAGRQLVVAWELWGTGQWQASHRHEVSDGLGWGFCPTPTGRCGTAFLLLVTASGQPGVEAIVWWGGGGRREKADGWIGLALGRRGEAAAAGGARARATGCMSQG